MYGHGYIRLLRIACDTHQLLKLLCFRVIVVASSPPWGCSYTYVGINTLIWVVRIHVHRYVGINTLIWVDHIHVYISKYQCINLGCLYTCVYV
jgi:hypothetical protein